MAEFQPLDYIVPHTGGTFSVILRDSTLTDENCTWNIGRSNSYFEAVINRTLQNAVIVDITAKPNNTTLDRKCILSLVRISTLDYSTITYNYEFTIKCDTTNLYIPIWKDTYFITNKTKLKYNIKKDNNEIIYSGYSVVLPDEDRIKIKLNPLVCDYIDNKLPNGITEGIYYLDDYCHSFYLNEINSITGETPLTRHNFYNDYSYTNKESIFLNKPIKTKLLDGREYQEVDVRQYSFISAFNDTENAETLFLYYPNENNVIQNEIYTLNNNSQLLKIDKTLLQRIGVGKNFFMRNQNNPNDILVRSVVKTCYDYCLYYRNAHNGYDSLLIQGNANKKDKIESIYYTKNADNTKQDFAKTKYNNVITTTYTMHTDWFNDEEQSKLHHLLESTEVYLHNLNTDEIQPVNITNNVCEYKTYSNNGRKKWYNTIEPEVSQNKIRK